MARLMAVWALVAVGLQVWGAQVGGGSVYGRQTGAGGALGNEMAKRSMSKEEMPPTNTSTFLDASVLVNVQANEYVAVFGVSEEGATLDAARQKVETTIRQFGDALKQLGVADREISVDFVAQNKIYGYEVQGDVAREKLTGFEVKKNVSIHYRDKDFLDKCLDAASHVQLFDLIKVDYVVRDVDAVHARLLALAGRVIKQKAASYEKLLGLKLTQPKQVYAEKYAAYYPSEMYDSYSANESEDISSGYLRQRMTVQGARKGRTFYFNALNAKSFDHVEGVVVTEPVVQFTLYLKVRCDNSSSSVAPHTEGTVGTRRAVRRR